MASKLVSDVSAANAALGRRFFEEQDRLKGGPAESLCARDYQAVLGGNPPVDRGGHEGFAKAFYAAFEGMAHTIERVTADDRGVAVRFVIRGTHTGSFFGIPPTGRSVRIVANVMMEVGEGKVTRLLGIFDEAGLLRQLGVIR